GLGHARRGQSAATDGVEHVLFGRHGEGLQHLRQLDLGQRLARPLQRLLQRRLAQTHELFTLGSADVAANGRAGPARDRQTAPVGGDFPLGPANDLDHVAVLKRGAHRLQLAVDLHTDGGVADFGVDSIGEVQRHPAARQSDQRALGRKDEDLIQVHFELGVLDPVFAPLSVFDDLNKMAQVQQGVAAAVSLHRLAVEAVGRVLVAPVRRNAVFGLLVHGMGADLHLDGHAFGADHRGVQRLVAVGLGDRDVVLEPPRHARPGAMDHPQGRIAVGLGVDDHPERVDVGKGRKADRLALQLAPDGIGRLFPSLDPRLHASFGQNALDLGRDGLDGAAVLKLQGLQTTLDGDAGRGVQMLERQFLQLGGDGVDADRTAQRRIDFQRFAADALALLRLHEVQGPHVVQAVGQLDQQDAHVLGDRQDELAQVLGLARVFGLKLQPRQLGHALNQDGDLLAEHGGDVVAGGGGVLHHVMQQGGDDGRRVQPII
uniref:NAD-specific glutamate dehydrogenase n=1 Tax=Parastrongyloides trichosuri TaxID=131310 RepID=A0A0N5A0C0_PARTI